MFLGRLRAVCLAATVLLLSSTVSAGEKNILFIGIDDMQVAAGCYGQTMMKTPQMDRLASKGMVFMNAYVQQAVCAAITAITVASQARHGFHIQSRAEALALT